MARTAHASVWWPGAMINEVLFRVGVIALFLVPVVLTVLAVLSY